VISTVRHSPIHRAFPLLLVAVLSLVFSLGIGGTLHPPGVFVKYTDAARHWEPSRIQDFSPFYLGFVRVFLPAVGVNGLRLLQALLLAAACASVAATVGLEAGLRAGVAAGVVAASYRPFLVYAGVLEPETLILCLLALALHAAYRARRTTGGRGHAAAWAALASVWLAFAAMARPQYVVLVPIWALWFASGKEAPRRWRQPAAALLAAAVLLIPFALHRLHTAGSLSVMNPGPVFYEGNGPQSPAGAYTPPHIVDRVARILGPGADLAHVAYRQVASAELGRPADPATTNRFWTALALDGLGRRPLVAARRFLSKALLALAPYELHDLVNAHDLDRRIRRILPWGFGLLLLLATISIPSLPGQASRVFPALSLAGLSWIVQIVFYPSARQRLPMALGLTVAAGILLACHPPHRRRSALTVSAALVLAFALTYHGAAIACWEEAGVSSVLGASRPSVGETAATFLDGRAWRPSVRRTADAAVLAEDSFDAGRPVTAGSPLATTLRQASGPAWLRARAGWLVARSLAVSGNPDGARELARQATALDPGLMPARALLAVLRKQDCPAGREEAVLVPGGSRLDAQLILAEAALAIRGPACARRVGSRVFTAFPGLEAPPQAQ